MPKLVRRGIEVEEQFTWVDEINPAEGFTNGGDLGAIGQLVKSSCRLFST